MRFSLLTFLIATICVGLAPYVYLHSSPWEPQPQTYTLEEVEALLNGKKTSPRSPDSTRRIYYDGSVGIQDERDRNILHLFSLRDSSSAFEMMFVSPTDKTPMHMSMGFIDDNRLLMAHAVTKGGKEDLRGRIWHRQYPEWWWGHLYRPEVWAMVAACLALAIQLFRGMRKRAEPIPSKMAQPSSEPLKPGTNP